MVQPQSYPFTYPLDMVLSPKMYIYCKEEQKGGGKGIIHPDISTTEISNENKVKAPPIIILLAPRDHLSAKEIAPISISLLCLFWNHLFQYISQLLY